MPRDLPGWIKQIKQIKQIEDRARKRTKKAFEKTTMAKKQNPKFSEDSDAELSKQDKIDEREGHNMPRSSADDSPDWLRAAGEKAAKKHLFGG